MKPSNDGSTIVLTLERYQDLLAAETKIQMIESARLSLTEYQFNSFCNAIFPAPKEDPDA
nr:hypothetical protein [Clostridia bacterium]